MFKTTQRFIWRKNNIQRHLIRKSSPWPYWVEDDNVFIANSSASNSFSLSMSLGSLTEWNCLFCDVQSPDTVRHWKYSIIYKETHARENWLGVKNTRVQFHLKSHQFRKYTIIPMLFNLDFEFALGSELNSIEMKLTPTLENTVVPSLPSSSLQGPHSQSISE